MRVLLVEDDEIIGDGLTVALKKQGIMLDWLKDGSLAINAIDSIGTIDTKQNTYDAIILDLSLPKVDGLDILNSWRKKGYTVPVLILTARGSTEEKVEGLNSGADDYLAKPFALAELVARIRALTRRNSDQAQAILSHGKVRLDLNKRKVFLADEEISLKPKGLMLLEIFLMNKETVFSRNSLEEKIYGWNEEVSSNAIEVHVHSIRSKLGTHFIKTVHGIGYTLGIEP